MLIFYVKDEIGTLIELFRHNKFKEKTLIIRDRGFESYNLLAHLTETEMYAAMTMFNFTSRIAREAVIRQPEEAIHAYHVNFKMTTALSQEYFRTEGADYEKLLEGIGRHTIPVRPNSQNKWSLKAKGFVAFTYRVSS